MNFKKMDKEYKTLFLLSAVFSFILPLFLTISKKALSEIIFSSSHDLSIDLAISALSLLGLTILLYSFIHRTWRQCIPIYIPSLLYAVINQLLFYTGFEMQNNKNIFLIALVVIISLLFTKTITFMFLAFIIFNLKGKIESSFKVYILSISLYQLFLLIGKSFISFLQCYQYSFISDIKMFNYLFEMLQYTILRHLITSIFNCVLLLIFYFLLQNALTFKVPTVRNKGISKFQNGLKISRAETEQADEMGSIFALSWRAAYAGIVTDDYLSDVTSEKRAEKLRRIIPESTDEYYLAKVENYPAGVLVLGQCRDTDVAPKTGEISALYYLPQFWGQGFGRQTMEFALNRLQELGFEKASLWVLEANTQACCFYEKCGFTKDGSKKEITLGAPLTEVRYVKTLAEVKKSIDESIIFGEKQPGLDYRERTGVYALLMNEESEIAVMKTDRGYFLPGGGLEESETHEECLKRELLEETGYSSVIGRFLGSAEYYSSTPPYVNHLIGFFYTAELTKRECAPSDADHELAWIPVKQSINSLKLPHQVWAVEKAITIMHQEA